MGFFSPITINIALTREELAAKYNNDEYLQMDKYDLGAVYYDWDKEAVERLRTLCLDYGAELVISSDWRLFSPLSRLKDYFRLHNLDQYMTGATEQITGVYRNSEVTAYLKAHPEITKFIILDDSYYHDFTKDYPDQFVYCHYIFDEECFKKAVSILTREDSDA